MKLRAPRSARTEAQAGPRPSAPAICAHAQHRSHRTARAGGGRRRRRRVRLRDRQGAGRSRRQCLRRNVAAGAQHLHEPARAREDGRVAHDCRRAGCSTFEKIYPLDAVYDTYDEMPEDVRDEQAVQGCRRLLDRRAGGSAWSADFGERPLDIVVHSLANGPEVKKPLLEVSRQRLPRRGERQRVLDGVDGPALRSADARPAARSSRSPTWRASA